MIGIPSIFPRLILEFLIFILFCKTLYINQRNKTTLHFKWGSWMIALLLITVFSAMINKQNILLAILFCRHLFIFYLFFISIYNSNISKSEIAKINYLLVGLMVIQIPAAIIKLLTFRRIVEGGGIGTVSLRDGSVAMLISLIPIAFLFSKYLYSKNITYFFSGISFLIVSIADRKSVV